MYVAQNGSDVNQMLFFAAQAAAMTASGHLTAGG
jgi:hypothetical protein